MYRILIATDGSEHGQTVIKEALLVAEALQADVTVLNVVQDFTTLSRVSVHFSDEGWEEVNAQLKEEGESIVAQAIKPFLDRGLKAEPLVILSQQSVADTICETAEEGNYNLIILGSRGLRGISEVFLGSVSNKVAHYTKVNLMIIKESK